MTNEFAGVSSIPTILVIMGYLSVFVSVYKTETVLYCKKQLVNLKNPYTVELFFHLGNDKLFRISTLDNYQGKLFEKIGVGTTTEDISKLDSSFVYNEFEEVWESDKGVFIETDAETNKVRWISVYIPELDLDDFEECNW